MSRKVLLSTLALMIAGLWVVAHVTLTLAATEEGKVVFDELKCKICHKPDKKGAGPSLKSIAEAYEESREELHAYLKGEAVPRLDLGKPNLMKGPLNRINERNEDEISNLADYILSFD